MKRLNDFQKAQIKLTFHYFLINFFIIAIASMIAIFIEQRFILQTLDPSKIGSVVQPNHLSLRENFREVHRVFVQRVLIFDFFLVLISAAAGYFMSGRTLRSIKEMMQKQEEFASDASHELRTPLATIQMEIEATRRTEKKIPSVYDKLLDSIQEESKRMTNTVSGLLTLVRSDTEEYRKEFDLAGITSQAIKQIKASSEAKKITISAKDLENAPVFGNEDQIRQAVLVLLDNAIRYTLDNGAVTVSTKSEDSKSSFVISDTGVGIPKDDWSKIFERFYRVSNRQINDQQRTGLGLSIAKKIIESHGGTISVASAPGEGSTFTINLPRHS